MIAHKLAQIIAEADRTGYLVTTSVATVMSTKAVQGLRTMWMARRRQLGLPYVELVMNGGKCIVTCNVGGRPEDEERQVRRLMKETHQEMVEALEGAGLDTDHCHYRHSGEHTYTVGHLLVETGIELAARLNAIGAPPRAVA